MPINFSTLVASESEIRKLFLDYFRHVIGMQQKLISFINSKYRISKKSWEAFMQLEKKCNEQEAIILDEAGWIISKDMPRAAHLRYLIAIIRSVKDLERMGDFAYNVAKYFYTCVVDLKAGKILAQIAQESLDVVKHFYNNIAIRKGQTKEYYLGEALNLIHEFAKSYKLNFKKLGQIIFDGDKRLDEHAIGAFTAAKNLERNTDHAYNIIENFTYIGEGNFFFADEARKSDK